MELSNEILQAARELGEALRADASTQAYLAACAEVERDAELCQLEAQLQESYAELVTRQRKGEVLSPQEINQFYKLREQVVYHPLITRREDVLKALKTSYEPVGSTLSSILSVDFTALALA